MINLSDVTICSVDCVTPALAGNSINISSKEIKFGDAVLFTDQSQIGNFRTQLIPSINSRREYSKFIIEDLDQHIQTKFALVVQWDGYVSNPKLWNSKFLECDYIGALWPWHKDRFRVGNGGFSLRSKKLLGAFSSIKDSISYQFNEDEIICKLYRPMLEKQGLVFANEQIANEFSYERFIPKNATFGFHGFFNMWRHCSDHEIILILEKINMNFCRTVDYFELLLCYLRQRKLNVYKAMHQKLVESLHGEGIEEHIKKFTNDPLLIKEVIESVSL